MPYEPVIISSQADMKKNIGQIAKRLNSNPEVSLLVLVNPVLALKELNIQLSGRMAKHVKNQLQYGSTILAQKKSIEEEINRLAGKKINPHSAKQLSGTLFGDLGLSTEGVLETRYGYSTTDSVLSQLSGSHPIVDKILELRRIRKGGVRFSGASRFEKFKSGESVVPWVTSIRFKE